jgi:hypothetical protein
LIRQTSNDNSNAITLHPAEDITTTEGDEEELTKRLFSEPLSFMAIVNTLGQVCIR